MKLTFLGTSHGVPARGRNCSCTMIETGGAIYFIDGGAPMIEEFLKIRTEADLKRCRAIFTTHAHEDHTFGIFNFMGLMNWFYKLQFDVYFTHQGFCDAVHNLYREAGGGCSEINPEYVRLHVEDPDAGYEDENIKLTFIPTDHMALTNSPSYAILLEAEGKRVLFSGDLSYKLRKNDMPKIVTEEHLDLFICEMAHFGLEELDPTLKACKADRVLINHVWPPYKFDAIKAAEKDYSFDMRTVDDGEVIEV